MASRFGDDAAMQIPRAVVVVGLVLASQLGRFTFVQDPQPAAASLADVPLATVCEQCFAGGDAGAKAQQELARRVENDYPAVFAAWESAANDRQRQCLEHALRIPEARAAGTIVSGAIARTETVQGGVVDYHTLLAHLTKPEVLRARDEDKDTLAHGYVELLRGSSWDWWLADQLAASIDRERARGPRVWLFVVEEYAHRRPQHDDRPMVLLRWSSLPATALPCLRRALQ